MEVVDFFRKPEKFRASGARPPKGVLLVGPPGATLLLLLLLLIRLMQILLLVLLAVACTAPCKCIACCCN
jgi:hypothetical protein